MNKSTMTYFKEEDILHIIVSDKQETDSIELSPNITAEIDRRGELIGIEILEAISFIKDFILEASKEKLLEFKKSYKNVSLKQPFNKFKGEANLLSSAILKEREAVF